MLNFLTKIIIKLLKKYPKLEENIVLYFDEKNMVSENEEASNVISQDKINKFKSVKAGDIVIAKTPNYKGSDDSHLYRPFFIVGRSRRKLHGLYGTTSTNAMGKEGYYHFYDKSRDKVSHYDCSKIYVLDINDFKNKLFSLDKTKCRKILDLLVKNCNFSNMVDFNEFEFEPKVGNVIISDKKYYILYGLNENKDFMAYELIKNENSKRYIKINNCKYTLNYSNRKIINQNDIDCVILDDANNYLRFLKENKPSKEKTKATYKEQNYNFADVLSLKNSKDKIIYLTRKNNLIYYVTEEQLELFTGIKYIDINMVSGFYRKLSDEEINKIINVLNKPLNNNHLNYVPDYVKNNILNNINVKRLK